MPDNSLTPLKEEKPVSGWSHELPTGPGWWWKTTAISPGEFSKPHVVYVKKKGRKLYDCSWSPPIIPIQRTVIDGHDLYFWYHPGPIQEPKKMTGGQP